MLCQAKVVVSAKSKLHNRNCRSYSNLEVYARVPRLESNYVFINKLQPLYFVIWPSKWHVTGVEDFNIEHCLFPLDFGFTSLTLSRPKPSWQMMWQNSNIEVLILKHQPSHWYLDMTQECRTFKSVVSYPCGWFLLVLTLKGHMLSLYHTQNLF